MLRVGRGSDIWHKVAASVVALAVPDFVLLILGRLDLVLYTSGGALCAMYAHGRPYAARARTLLWVVLGSLVGLVVFTAVLPLTRAGQVALVLTALAFQAGAEALMSRNYWLGTVCVTPMALLVVEFAGAQPAGRLVADRWLDTCVGAVIGLLGCVLITNRRAGHRIDEILDRVVLADATARALLDTAWGMNPRDLAAARDRLMAALVELREAVDAASGEWWQHALPEERIGAAEREGHRTLARVALRLSAPVSTALAS
ncbi:MAG: FUSC family protein [Actinoallomurus sp.]